jgi:predicted CoA-binding protein
MANEKKDGLTVVLGASPNPSRVSNMAVRQLKNRGFEVIPVGIRKGEIDGIAIQVGKPAIQHVHTVSLYIGPALQQEQGMYDYVLQVLKPRRVIFNPGTENPEFYSKCQEKGIQVLPACTLVMLSLGTYFSEQEKTQL